MKQTQATDYEIARFIADHLTGRCYHDGTRFWWLHDNGEWKPSRGPGGPVHASLDRIRGLFPADSYWDRARYRCESLAASYTLLSLARNWLPIERPVTP